MRSEMNLKSSFVFYKEKRVLAFRIKTRSYDEILHLVVSHINDAVAIFAWAKHKGETL